MTSPTGEDSSNVGRIALRLPMLWRNNVAFWIRQRDSAFVLSQFTQDETKYAALPFAAKDERTVRWSIEDEFLKNLWLQRLPSQIQAVLSVSSETLDKLAEIVDKVADVALLAAVYSTTSTPEPNASAEIHDLAKQIAELKLQLSRMSRPRNRQFFRRKSSSRSRNRNRTTNREAICFYHKRFRESAHNCIPPCDFLHRESRDRPSSQSEN
ncbi:uncharacterized protein TNCV_3268641 [Trichonephila clavipes]|nr:uncharacterized protein TNCV_3268641 [Trichonephila clavipes]